MSMKKKLLRAYQKATPDLLPSLMEHCPKPRKEKGSVVPVARRSRVREFIATAAAIALVIGMGGGLFWLLNSGTLSPTLGTQPTETQHEHSFETTVVPPDCINDGYTVYTCACGYTTQGDSVPREEHLWENSKCKNCGITEPVTFPLEEPVTFTMMVNARKDITEEEFQERMESIPLYQKLKEMTNVSIEIMYFEITGSMDPRPMPYGDFHIGSANTIPTNTAVNYMEKGLLQPITEYINPINMPNFWADLMECPEVLNMITAPDGEIYTLPRITGWGPKYLESPMWINKTWLDNLGLDVPATLEELEHVLKEFAAKDANKNGSTTDEIPWLVSASHNNMHLEALYGLWGYGVKQSTNDMYLQIIDGQVIMSTTQEEWAEYLTWVKDLYDAGVLYKDVFTSNSVMVNSYFNSPDSCIGFCTNTTYPQNTEDEWISLAPVSNGDYQARWFYNCASLGTKGNFYVTDKCKNVNILCAWMDLFYDFDIAYELEAVEGSYTIDENGNYIFTGNIYSDEESYTLNSIGGGNWPRAYTPSDYDRIFSDVTSATTLAQEAAYEKYASVVNTEIWPRPYWDPDICMDIGPLATEIDYTVKYWREAFITGRKDIQNDWDAYLAEMGYVGLSEYMGYAQDAYDRTQEIVDMVIKG